MHQLEMRGIDAAYRGQPVLKGVNLTVGSGEIVSLIGPSGSGKSTLLRTLVGLLQPSSGEIKIDGTPVDYASRRELKAVRDRIAIVFQQYNLFQNMDVLRNVTIAPIKVKGRNASEVTEEARAVLASLGLADKLKSYPDQLSGGQQQRVAIARAMVLKPELLLLDEVTSALDPELVSEVLDAIRLLARGGMTMLVVSHEMGFVREVSSKVVFMADGRVVETGAPDMIFDRPQELRTRDFVRKILRH